MKCASKEMPAGKYQIGINWALPRLGLGWRCEGFEGFSLGGVTDKAGQRPILWQAGHNTLNAVGSVLILVIFFVFLSFFSTGVDRE